MVNASSIVAGLIFLTVLCSIGSRAVAADIVEDLQQGLQVRDQIIRDLVQRVEVLEAEVRVLRDPPSARVGSPSTAPAPPPPTSRDDEEERLARAALERTLIARGGLLLPPWTVEFEPSFTYVHSSSDRISIDGFTILPVLVVGEIVSERVRRDTLLSTLTFRLGLPWDFQVESRIPFRYELQRIVSAENREQTLDTSGIGDMEFAISRQLMGERGWIPDLLAGLRWKTATGRSSSSGLALGTGFHGLQMLLTAVKARDPVVFFGSVSYTANLPAEKSVGRVDPGDTWGINLGLGLALSPETSVNFGWEQRFANKTTVRGQAVPGSQLSVGTLRLGATHILGRRMSIDVGVGVGLTQDAPDVQATIALPIRFSL